MGTVSRVSAAGTRALVTRVPSESVLVWATFPCRRMPTSCDVVADRLAIGNWRRQGGKGARDNRQGQGASDGRAAQRHHRPGRVDRGAGGQPSDAHGPRDRCRPCRATDLTAGDQILRLQLDQTLRRGPCHREQLDSGGLGLRACGQRLGRRKPVSIHPAPAAPAPATLLRPDIGLRRASRQRCRRRGTRWGSDRSELGSDHGRPRTIHSQRYPRGAPYAGSDKVPVAVIPNVCVAPSVIPAEDNEPGGGLQLVPPGAFAISAAPSTLPVSDCMLPPRASTAALVMA